MEQPPAISVCGLNHEFASRNGALTVLSNIDLDVKTGDFVSIIGPSGSGKTTLLKAIGGLLEPTSGRIAIGGLSPVEARRSRAIGFVFQDPALLPWRDVFQNVLLPLEIKAAKTPEANEMVKRLLEAVGLAEFSRYYPQELSGGMKQRVALARALAIDPAVLLMDEPLGALDEITRISMRYELLRIWEQSKKTVLFVTHSIPEAVILSDHVIVLSRRPGRILKQIDIDLPRPRDESAERSERFLDYTYEIKEALSLGAASGASALQSRATYPAI
jgi:NitT/TauT family transport system ATP-binding protein